MCLVALAWRTHPRYPLILLGNRDEFHARPSAAADWWTDLPDGVAQVLGGRDLEAGGSWLAMNRAGRVAVVTNYPLRRVVDGRSRGLLVREALTAPGDVREGLDAIAADAGHYAGFSLLVADPQAAASLHAHRTPVSAGTLAPGIHVYSNAPPPAHWPKAEWLREQLGRILAASDPLHAPKLLDILREPGPVRTDIVAPLPPVAWQPFVSAEAWGTRSGTAVLVDAAGECAFSERRFGPDGEVIGESHFAFTIGSGV